MVFNTSRPTGDTGGVRGNSGSCTNFDSTGEDNGSNDYNVNINCSTDHERCQQSAVSFGLVDSAAGRVPEQGAGEFGMEDTNERAVGPREEVSAG